MPKLWAFYKRIFKDFFSEFSVWEAFFFLITATSFVAGFVADLCEFKNLINLDYVRMNFYQCESLTMKDISFEIFLLGLSVIRNVNEN